MIVFFNLNSSASLLANGVRRARASILLHVTDRGRRVYGKLHIDYRHWFFGIRVKIMNELKLDPNLVFFF